MQPFWEMIEFLYEHAHELGASSKVKLHLFKEGVLPDCARPPLSRGARLVISLSGLISASSRPMSIHDAISALLMHLACATSEHEAHVFGLDLSFEADGVASSTVWYDEALASDDGAASDLREEIAEALHVYGDAMHECMRVEVAPSRPIGPPQSLVVQALAQHPNALLNKLQVPSARRRTPSRLSGAPPFFTGRGRYAAASPRITCSPAVA